MCNRECRQGRDCHCGPQSKIVNGLAALIWLVCFFAVVSILWGLW
jgi:hypothetical protein